MTRLKQDRAGLDRLLWEYPILRIAGCTEHDVVVWLWTSGHTSFPCVDTVRNWGRRDLAIQQGREIEALLSKFYASREVGQ